MTDDERRITGGGGIVRGSRRGPSTPADSDVDVARAFRRRWATGVAVMTVRDGELYRGMTVTAMMPLSVDPLLVAVGVSVDGAFAERVPVGARCAVSILVREQEFLSERFAGRAPVPDAAFTGVPHTLDAHGVPVLSGATASLSGRIASRERFGDHHLLIIDVDDGSIAPDEDDPLLSYEGAYRGLEVG